jgi:hypothetical protein
MPQSGAAVFRRQGFDRHVAACGESLQAGQVSVSAAAHRYRAQLSRGHGVSRRARGRTRRAPDRRQRRGIDPHGPGAPALAGRKPQRAPVGDAARYHCRIQIRRLHRRRPPRRGKGPRQGADLFVPGRVRPVGSQEPASGTLEPVQHPRASGREHARVPDQQLDGTGRLAVHRPRRARSAFHLLRTPPRSRAPSRRDPARFRTGSADDQTSEASMELRKKEGYF